MNIWGEKLKITLFGESHGDIVGIVIDGVPSGMEIDKDMFMPDILRRKSGKIGTTSRIERDEPRIISGIYEGFSTGAPVTILFDNNDYNSDNYTSVNSLPRPGHADYTASVKYNFFNDVRGGGQFSGRLMLPVVAAGVIAKRILKDIVIKARIVEVGGVKTESEDPLAESQIEELITKVKGEGDSIGGIIECVVDNMPVGMGDPMFGSVESQISSLVFSIPGVRGIEFGDGFSASKMRGSEHNDPFTDKEGKTLKNGAGGVNGGISNGNPIVFRVAVKPTSSISKTQYTYNFQQEQMQDLNIAGRHDVCFALRVPVIIEAVTSIALCQF